jgi:hypothetical protein
MFTAIKIVMDSLHYYNSNLRLTDAGLDFGIRISNEYKTELSITQNVDKLVESLNLSEQFLLYL